MSLLRGATGRCGDHLSDQPHHQHASRLDKLAIRLADDLTVVARAAPRVWRRYRRAEGGSIRRRSRSAVWGVCAPTLGAGSGGAVVELLDDLGVRHIRRCSTPGMHDLSRGAARRRGRRGYGLMFTIPQNRDLVRDRERRARQ